MSGVRFMNRKYAVKFYFEVITQHSENTEENHKIFTQDNCLSSKI
jgi:hypothetical protein